MALSDEAGADGADIARIHAGQEVRPLPWAMTQMRSTPDYPPGPHGLEKREGLTQSAPAPEARTLIAMA